MDIFSAFSLMFLIVGIIAVVISIVLNRQSHQLYKQALRNQDECRNEWKKAYDLQAQSLKTWKRLALGKKRSEFFSALSDLRDSLEEEAVSSDQENTVSEEK